MLYPAKLNAKLRRKPMSTVKFIINKKKNEKGNSGAKINKLLDVLFVVN